MRLGVFGGTFDPPHVGHLVVAQDAWSALALDRVLFVLAASPPHKQGRAYSPAPLRLEMLRAALADDERFEACDLELRRPGPSYTVDTLRQLHEEHPGAELFLLIGADQAREFLTWKAPGEIAALATIVALSRDGDHAAAPPLDGRVHALPVTRLDVSATDLRRRVAEDRPIRYLVPAGVEAVIRREGLYRSPASAGVGALGPSAPDRPRTPGV